jgi:hypothetical protein
MIKKSRMTRVHIEIVYSLIICWTVDALSLSFTLWLAIIPALGAGDTMWRDGIVSFYVCMTADASHGNKCLRCCSVAHLRAGLVVSVETKMIWGPR